MSPHHLQSRACGTWVWSVLLSVTLVACGSSNPSQPTSTAPSPAQADPTQALAPSSDWPMYGHDTSRTNYNAGEKILSAATIPTLAQAWHADIGSNGNPSSSAPVVAAGSVYVGSSVDSGDNLFGFDASTGANIWSANVGHVAAGAPGPCGEVGIGSTASVDSGMLVIGGGDGAYYGLDASSGTLLWRQPLTAGPSSFAWASPLVAGGKAYLGTSSGCDNPPVPGELTAVDKASGAVLVNQFFEPTGLPGAGIWNSPSLSPDGKILFVATGEDNGDNGPYEQAVVALDPQTLAILQADTQGDVDQDLDFVTTPVVFGDEKGRVLVGASHKNGTFYAYVAARVGAGPVWTRHVGAVIGLAPAYDPNKGAGGTLLFGGTDGSGNAQIHATNPGTGADRWVVGVGQTAGNIAVANGLVFIVSGDGSVLVLDEATGRQLRTLTPAQPGPSYTGATLAEGTVFWVAGSVLNAWRPSS